MVNVAQCISKETLTFDHGVEIVTSFEQAHSKTKKLSTSESERVHAMKDSTCSRKPRQQKASLQCSRCNGTNHDTSTCRYVNTKCNFCSIVGHIERACHKRKKQQEAATKRSRPRKLHKVDEEEGSSS